VTLIGWLIFIFALLFSIILHEAGHFVTAKKFHMKVTQFFVGFGQTLWSTTKGETEYGLKVIPAGGYVKIVGMTALEDDVDPADEPRSFRRQPGWQRIIVLAAGSFMHFVLAFVLLFIMAVGIGVAAESNSTTVGTIDPCVPKSESAPSCVKGDPASPAVKVGLRPGDTIVALAGQPVHNWAQLGSAIRSHPAGSAVAVTVRRHGQTLTLHPSLAAISGRKGSYLGISPTAVFQTVNPVRGVISAGSQFGQIVTGSVGAVGSVPAQIPKLFAKSSGSSGGVTSIVGAGQITGQAFALNVSWQVKVTVVLDIIVSINIFVGLFNLFPLLPLDGGHLAVVIYERARAWLARLRGKPDPGLVDMRKLVPVSVGVFVLVVGFSLILIMANLVNPVHIPQ
jgi:membrane-associated protease RseP (regulator of RpoE activity)